MIELIEKVLGAHFGDCEKSITEVSYNKTGRKGFYEGEFKLYCLDSIVEKEFKIEPKSADGLYITQKGIFLIEFKEGNQKNIKSHDIKLKLFEALNVLYKVISSKAGVPISKTNFWDQKFHYIVIYRDDEKDNSFGARLGRSVAKWGLEEYKGLYVNTATTEYNPHYVQLIFNKMTSDSCGIVKPITT
ncbi:hypothetical protein GQ853_23885 [Vibrio parahaemolyticus]|nr:hypothetical protein [Vibrio parahaemolyticus]